MRNKPVSLGRLTTLNWFRLSGDKVGLTKAFLWVMKMINDIAIKAAEYWHHVERAENAMTELRKMVLLAGRELSKMTPEEKKEMRENKKAGIDKLVESGFKWGDIREKDGSLGWMTPEQAAVEHGAGFSSGGCCRKTEKQSYP